ncbi:MAG: penicillin-binding protein 2 [Marinifilaceae bacterium]
MKQYSDRKITIGIIFVTFALIFIVRLFYIQIIDNKYKLSADNNSQRQITQYPARGLIYDRNGKLLVSNQAAYDLMIIPRQVKTIDTIDFCEILSIDKKYFIETYNKCRKYSRYKASIFMSQIDYKTYAVLQEKLHKFHGFFVQTRTLRKYQYNSSAHVLGYIGEVNRRNIRKDEYYTSGDYIGKSGLEYTYEKQLRGDKGRKIYVVDVHNRKKGSYKDGKYDKTAKIGKNITTSIDIDLQMYAEKLMQNKKGGIVAIEPSTGEILVKISAPGYDPKLFIGNKRGHNYGILQKDSLKPLFDRALMATYPPGSIFKPVQALIGLEEQVITENTSFPCHGGYIVGGFKMRCHNHQSPLDLRHSIAQSCNAYYAHTFRNILEQPKYTRPRDGYIKWRDYVKSFGFGEKLGVDIPYEKKGFIPKAEYWDKRYRYKNWKALNIISLAIGQGDLLITPLQMANMVSTIANRGTYIAPHIVKKISNSKLDEKFLEKHKTKIEAKYFKPVIEGMEMVTHVNGATAKLSKIDSIKLCGKTGTVEHSNKKKADHGVFVAFAPMVNPKIAIVVYVENGVWGGKYAAPIASLIIEKYLKGYIPKNRKFLEKRMIKADLIANPNER